MLSLLLANLPDLIILLYLVLRELFWGVVKEFLGLCPVAQLLDLYFPMFLSSPLHFIIPS